MLKKSLIFILVIFAFFAFDHSAYALQITCSDKTTPRCSLDTSALLFNAQNIYPGWSASQTIRAVNNYPEDLEFGFEIFDLVSTPVPGADLADTLNLVIKDGSEVKWSDKILESNAVYVPLSIIKKGEYKDYTLEVSMDTLAGNEYQDKRVEFDIRIGFDGSPVSSGSGGGDDDDDNGGGGGIGGRGGSSRSGPGLGSNILGVQTVSLVSAPAAAPGPGEAEPLSAPTGTVSGLSDETAQQAVAGTTDIACVDPWWWFLVFILQIIVHLIVRLMVDKSNKGSVAVGLLYQVVAAVIFAVIFWNYFCPRWDVYVSVLISLAALLLQRKTVRASEI